MTSDDFLGAVMRPGWVQADRLDLGAALLTYADGSVAFRHLCDRGERGVIVASPLLRIGAGHTLTRDEQDRPTVDPSVQCGDCGAHGWVKAGRWTTA